MDDSRRVGRVVGRGVCGGTGCTQGCPNRSESPLFGASRFARFAIRTTLAVRGFSCSARGQCSSVALGRAGRPADERRGGSGGWREGMEGRRGASVGGSRVAGVGHTTCGAAGESGDWVAECRLMVGWNENEKGARRMEEATRSGGCWRGRGRRCWAGSVRVGWALARAAGVRVEI